MSRRLLNLSPILAATALVLAANWPAISNGQILENVDNITACKHIGQQVGTFAILRDGGYTESAAVSFGIAKANDQKALIKGSKLSSDLKTIIVAAADIAFNKEPYRSLDPSAAEALAIQGCLSALQKN